MRRIDALRLLAGGCVLLVAIIHLGHRGAGFPALVVYTAAGTPIVDPRPLAFTLSGIALIVGVFAVWNGLVPRRPAYAAAMAMMAVYLVGYVAWHATGHGGFWPTLEARHHDMPVVELLITHLAADRVELLSKTLEATALVVLGYLLYRDTTASA